MAQDEPTAPEPTPVPYQSIEVGDQEIELCFDTLTFYGAPYRDNDNYTVRAHVEIDLTEELAYDLMLVLQAKVREFAARRGA